MGKSFIITVAIDVIGWGGIGILAWFFVRDVKERGW